MIKYAGTGSTKTPEDVCVVMANIAHTLGGLGFLLRSGHAKGADKAFEYGCDVVKGHKEIFIPQMVSGPGLWTAHAETFHPAWHNCDEYVRKLHARNSPIILGTFLNDPVDFVVCWTSNGKIKGGTGQGMRIAQANNIPIFNLFNPTAFEELQMHVRMLS